MSESTYTIDLRPAKSFVNTKYQKDLNCLIYIYIYIPQSNMNVS